jgi:hypothetical protein
MSKQASLFSFFKKAPVPVVASEETSELLLQSQTQKQVEPKKAVATNEKSAQNETKVFKVGTRISIFWPMDDTYYDGELSFLKFFRMLLLLYLYITITFL